MDESPVMELIGDSNGGPAIVYVHPVVQPAKDPGQEFDEQLERDRLWKYASLRRSVEEVAKVYGISTEAFGNRVTKAFKVTWDQLSEQAFLEMQFEVEANIYMRARGNDARFVLLYQKLQGLPGFYEPGDTPQRRQPLQLPQGVKDDLSHLSIEALMKRRADLAKVLDRPNRFGVNGLLSPTLELTESEPGAAVQEQKPWNPLPVTADPIPAVEVAPEPEVKEVVAEPIKVVQGPVTARPDAGMLHL